MREIFVIFLRLGMIGFGGPIALVSLIEREICHNKKWLTLEEFAGIFSVCKLLPGPMAVQVAICCGYHKGKRWGGFVAGVGFLLPALVMIIALGILYTHHFNPNSPHLLHVFKFMQDATIAVILITLWSLGKVYVKNYSSAIIALICTALVWYLPTMEPLIILGFGALGLIVYKTTHSDLYYFPGVIAISSTTNWLGFFKTEFIYNKLLQLFWICIKAGEFSFGTGLAILPLLHADLVTSHGWISNQQFIDGLTVGQITPGPTTISIVFYGFIIAGLPGLMVALLGFYIPPMVNALFIIPLFWKKLTGSPYLRIFTMWAFPAVIGGIASATLKLGISSITSLLDGIFLVAALILLFKNLLPIWALIPLYGVLGLLWGYWII